MSTGRLADLTLDAFTLALAAKEPVPGGGAASACLLAQAAALGSMVIEYSVDKPKFAVHRSRLEHLAQFLGQARSEALDLADRDASAYCALNAMWKIPAAERATRADWQSTVTEAIAAPSAIADLAMGVLAALGSMSSITSAQLASDLNIAKRFAHTALECALLNVEVNLPALSEGTARAAGERFLDSRRREGATLLRLPREG
ncbi:MAG: sugar ABC transporter substrate-binding protein [Phycisphaerales bacterium]|nr:sugar ABC transporter substrate-binding protein [Phycisphaerales bacterium]